MPHGASYTQSYILHSKLHCLLDGQRRFAADRQHHVPNSKPGQIGRRSQLDPADRLQTVHVAQLQPDRRILGEYRPERDRRGDERAGETTMGLRP